MRKKSFKVKKCINPNIEVGDSIRLIDGSGLSHISIDENFYIIYPYEEVTGLSSYLKHIHGTVVSVGVNDRVTSAVLDMVYLQDVVIKLGKAEFRTCSNFLMKI